jgi:hypothetical protein
MAGNHQRRRKWWGNCPTNLKIGGAQVIGFGFLPYLVTDIFIFRIYFPLILTVFLEIGNIC